MRKTSLCYGLGKSAVCKTLSYASSEHVESHGIAPIKLTLSRVLYQRRSAIARASERNAQHNWIKLVSKQGPWDEVNDPLALSGAPSLPMPVDQSDKESLAPFFAHLALDGTHEPASTPVGSANGVSGFEPYHETGLIEFEKGVLYADGRIDLCKMVTGPRNIGDLMESLKSNTSSKHFLLGNNITGPTGGKEISRFIDEYPDKFEVSKITKDLPFVLSLLAWHIS